ncbi:hypothetical protein ACS8YF_00320 [Salinisphaera sp. SWV1]|uniref:hypothetical protein n=1 Tax=Salinisphaera sp. SWV1 TaxID=3454139 RepID=UPI003F8306B4
MSEKEKTTFITERYRRTLDELRDMAAAVDGLLKLQEKIFDDSGTGEMPEWWSERYQSAINLAIGACVEKTSIALEFLEDL